MEEQTNLTGLIGAQNQKTESGFFPWDQDKQVNFEAYAGGFMGINFTGLKQLEADVKENIIGKAQDAIEGFANDDAVWNTALQGKTKAAAIKYVEEVKNLLYAYISTYNDFITLADQAAEALITNDTGNQGIIENAVDTISGLVTGIETEAATIDVDGASSYIGIN